MGGGNPNGFAKLRAGEIELIDHPLVTNDVNAALLNKNFVERPLDGK